MKVKVLQSHVLGLGRYAEVGQVIDLEDRIARTRIAEGYCAPIAPPAPKPGRSKPGQGELGEITNPDPNPGNRDPKPDGQDGESGGTK